MYEHIYIYIYIYMYKLRTRMTGSALSRWTFQWRVRSTRVISIGRGSLRERVARGRTLVWTLADFQNERFVKDIPQKWSP